MKNQQYPCFYPGTFAPPTKNHLNAAFWLESRPEVSQVIVVLGKEDDNGVTQDQKFDIWSLYLKTTNARNIVIEKSSSGSSLKCIYDKFSKNPNLATFIAVDQITAKNDTFMETFDRFANYKIQLIPSQSEEDSDKMLAAANSNDYRDFKRYLPNEVSDEGGKRCFDLLKAKDVNEAINSDWYQGSLNKIFSKYKIS